MKKISSRLTEVIFTSNFMNFIPQDAIFITHNKLYKLYLKNVRAIFIPEGETSKNMETIIKIISRLIKLRFERFSHLVAFGGGVVGDITGFVASIYKRGVPYIQIPTTLLAMVDSSIGGKTGVDFGGVKNAVGSFYQPEKVIVDVGFLKTLPVREYKNGVAEIIKYGFIKDPDIFELVEKNITKAIYRSISIKLEVVEKDERELTGLREILNFGHTVGHAIESSFNYRIPHGAAITTGMVAESFISHIYGLRSEYLEFVTSTIKRFKLGIINNLEPRKILMAIENDKKIRSGSLRCVLLKKPGMAYVRKVEKRDILRALNFISTLKL